MIGFLTQAGVVTKPIPAEEYKQILGRHAHRYIVQIPSPIAQEPRTDFPDLEEFLTDFNASKLRLGLQSVGVATIAIMIGHVQAAAEDEYSRPVFCSDTFSLLTQLNSVDEEYPVASFYEPVTFHWTKSAHRVRQAAKRYSEQSHADY